MPSAPEELEVVAVVQREAARAEDRRDDPEARCLPTGVPRRDPYPTKIIQTDKVVVILYEGNIHSFRQIFMNQEHPKDVYPTWYGHSVGKWVKDELVVDTIGFNDKTELPGGYRHTEALHVVERFRRVTFDHLEYQATIEDPNVFAKPWMVHRTLPLRTDLQRVDEFICENNRDYSVLFKK